MSHPPDESPDFGRIIAAGGACILYMHAAKPGTAETGNEGPVDRV
jgi:hypothetical protein